jgi:hypothetical protein
VKVPNAMWCKTLGAFRPVCAPGRSEGISALPPCRMAPESPTLLVYQSAIRIQATRAGLGLEDEETSRTGDDSRADIDEGREALLLG